MQLLSLTKRIHSNTKRAPNNSNKVVPYVRQNFPPPPPHRLRNLWPSLTRSSKQMYSLSSFSAISVPRASSPSSKLSPFPSPQAFHFPRLSLKHFRRFGVKCNYAGASVTDDSNSKTIDVVADVKTERLVVLGGNGFVGSAICKAAVSNGIEAVSLSRSGRPTLSDSWVEQVTWLTGDVFYANWDEVLLGATAVVSTLGGFGSEEQMLRINGEANVVAINAAKEYGIPKFILISVHDYNLPSFLLQSGYFTGKRKAESELLSKYSASGVVLRPGFIYGKRKVDGFELPLDLIGKPVESLLSSVEIFTKPMASLPASDLLFAPPVSVDDVALAVTNAVMDSDMFGVFTIEQIKEAAAKVRV